MLLLVAVVQPRKKPVPSNSWRVCVNAMVVVGQAAGRLGEGVARNQGIENVVLVGTLAEGDQHSTPQPRARKRTPSYSFHSTSYVSYLVAVVIASFWMYLDFSSRKDGVSRYTTHLCRSFYKYVSIT